ncbi:prisilkin-39 isoform X1 [Stomoxys calcitrans]|uniref:Prisilkin-39-like n=1 Tax=Stomoxys calcitrans TaxID=35570 RepID=A0A1I8PYM8_STOCA|nr:prisilkin-39 isoform X1 [Stomoxys calcitrans]
MSNNLVKVLFLATIIAVCWATENNIQPEDELSGSSDMQTSATSAKLLNLGGLLGGGGYYPNNNRPAYYPNSGYYPTGGYYPSSGGFYPSTGGYANNGYYPTNTNYPTNGYYPNSAYPNNGYPYSSTSWNNAGYNPSSTYYPSTGTNILGGTGNGGYGGYGGNGGLRQYNGYWNPNYVGRRNLGYGYYKNTDRYGLPKLVKEHRYGGGGGRQESDQVPHSYRGYD